MVLTEELLRGKFCAPQPWHYSERKEHLNEGQKREGGECIATIHREDRTTVREGNRHNRAFLRRRDAKIVTSVYPRSMRTRHGWMYT